MQKVQKVINKQKCVSPRKNYSSLEPYEQQNSYEIIIVRKDTQDSVEVIESEDIDFGIVMQQLVKGNSVFLGPKIKGELEAG